jgi:hypothetical protein
VQSAWSDACHFGKLLYCKHVPSINYNVTLMSRGRKRKWRMEK